MNKKVLNIMLADDDEDDQMLFEMAMKEVAPEVKVNFASDGEELMGYLTEAGAILPQILFLDLNMPFKNGKECLKEIRSNTAFDDMPVIIYSTSCSDIDIDETYNLGANLYIEKPIFSKLKACLVKVLQLDWSQHHMPDKEHYVSIGCDRKGIFH